MVLDVLRKFCFIMFTFPKGITYVIKEYGHMDVTIKNKFFIGSKQICSHLITNEYLNTEIKFLPHKTFAIIDHGLEKP
jgi:hypothetical protein